MKELDIDKIIAMVEGTGWSVAGLHDREGTGFVGLIVGEHDFVAEVLEMLDADIRPITLDS